MKRETKMWSPSELLPSDAELVLTAERVLWVRGTVVVGRVACDELRLGDEVVAVGDAPICRGRVTNLQRFMEQPEVVKRGDEVAIMFHKWEVDTIPQNVRLFRLPGQSSAK